MSEKKEKKEKKKSRDGVEKKKSKHEKKHKSSKIKDAVEKKQDAVFSLLADEKATNPTLSSLFAAKPTPPQRSTITPAVAPKKTGVADQAANDEELSEIELDDNEEDVGQEEVSDETDVIAEPDVEDEPEHVQSKRKKKRKHAEDDIEDAYMQRLAREEAKEAEAAAAERAAKRRKAAATEQQDADVTMDGEAESGDDEAGIADVDAENDGIEEEDDDAASPPPKHETEQMADLELAKANSTVFLGNVSTSAISSKSDRKMLLKHLQSFFPKVTTKENSKPSVLSLRFRSTPYASAIPKKAAFATKQLMPATASSTNAYAIYSTPALAREAVKHLNGTIVLERHLRVDSVAHPAKVDHHRCVFVGNLGFVDDESNIQAANAEEGKEHRKPAKQPSDVEEGLWRTFGKCGKVESVRVIRDGTTRVGKGIAYVQFVEDEGKGSVAVEEALALDGKKFPPMLPRKLRVSRAKAMKRNAKPESGRPGSKPATAGTGYKRRITGEEASKIGRTGKLFGRAAAAQARKSGGASATGANDVKVGEGGIRKPESFVFEGYRAKQGGGKAGLKLGGRKKKGGRVTGRSRAFKAKSKGGKS